MKFIIECANARVCSAVVLRVAYTAVQVTHDISHLTCADVFRAPGVQTPVITRFSTVIHERGSPETLRDPRGFAVKFYTREGNWDLVGNNMPVFFIRDGIKFPDMIHALKPNPKNHIQEDWRIADFFSHVPEAMHMVGKAGLATQWFLSLRGILCQHSLLHWVLVARQGQRVMVTCSSKRVSATALLAPCMHVVCVLCLQHAPSM